MKMERRAQSPLRVRGAVLPDAGSWKGQVERGEGTV